MQRIREVRAGRGPLLHAAPARRRRNAPRLWSAAGRSTGDVSGARYVGEGDQCDARPWALLSAAERGFGTFHGAPHLSRWRFGIDARAPIPTP